MGRVPPKRAQGRSSDLKERSLWSFVGPLPQFGIEGGEGEGELSPPPGKPKLGGWGDDQGENWKITHQGIGGSRGGFGGSPEAKIPLSLH
eukprot:787750-Pyramimonas_sp.AAC.2